MKRISLKAGLLLFFSLLLAVAAVLSPLAAWAQATWGSDQLIENNAGFNGYNPQVAISGSQAVAVWYQDDGSNNRIYSNCSSDSGANWGSAQPINNASYSGYNPKVAIDGSQVVAVWEQTDGLGPYRIYSNCSSDGGANWGSDQLIEDNAGYSGYNSQVAMSGSQAVAVWQQYDGSSERIYSNYSSDGGANWGSDQLIENNDGYSGYAPQVAISGSQAVAVWNQYDGSDYRIYSNRSSDGGANWGSDQLIENNDGYDGYAPQLAMSGSQAVAVWFQYDGSDWRIYGNCSSDGGANWGSDQLIENNAGHDAGGEGDDPQVAISGSQAVAVWYQDDGSNWRIYGNCSSDGGATWGSDQLIEDNAGYYGYDPQVAISGSQAVAVWEQYDGSTYRIYSNYATQVPVGGTLYPVNKVGVLTPWVVLAVAVIAGGIWLVRRRVYS